MSIIGLLGIPKFVKNLKPINLHLRNLSRRSNNVELPYKIVKSRTAKDESALVWRDPNFEILASPSGFPFFLPGGVSPAWYDKRTTFSKIVHDHEDILCQVQECPAVLRQTICDLFPSNNFTSSDISVVTITLKPDIKLFRKNNETETEKLAQTFVLTACNICDKLCRSGYWADFINPFSGKPYVFPTSRINFCETDETIGCSDFQISKFNDCKVIVNDNDKAKKKFIGSIFTNAPTSKCNIDKMLSVNK